MIELLIVIAIVGLLASVILTSMLNSRIKARDANRLENIRQLSTALELYYQDHSGFPVQASPATTIPGLAPTYLALLPLAPLPADGATCAATVTGGTNNDYLYSAPASSAYTLTFCLGIGTSSYPAGVHTLSPRGIE